MRRRTPGASERQSPIAALPVRSARTSVANCRGNIAVGVPQAECMLARPASSRRPGTLAANCGFADGSKATRNMSLFSTEATEITSLRKLRDAEAQCTRCPLYRNATQVGPGEGPISAGLVLVGEQPGIDQDRPAKRFVVPAAR